MFPLRSVDKAFFNASRSFEAPFNVILKGREPWEKFMTRSHVTFLAFLLQARRRSRLYWRDITLRGRITKEKWNVTSLKLHSCWHGDTRGSAKCDYVVCDQVFFRENFPEETQQRVAKDKTNRLVGETVWHLDSRTDVAVVTTILRVQTAGRGDRANNAQYWAGVELNTRQVVYYLFMKLFIFVSAVLINEICWAHVGRIYFPVEIRATRFADIPRVTCSRASFRVTRALSQRREFVLFRRSPPSDFEIDFRHDEPREKLRFWQDTLGNFRDCRPEPSYTASIRAEAITMRYKNEIQ